MDSGNSGSLQSSTGGDDDFDSRCGADSSPLSALLRQQQPPSPSSSSVPEFGGGGSLIYGLQELRTPLLAQSSHHWCSTSTAPLPSPPPLLCRDDGLAPAASAGDHHDQQPAPPPRGSRKRPRASRRAPTTVLTTDTSNFRAMVQEFTGIPAPPFAAASASARSRFDHLFPSRSSGSAAGSGGPAALPQYLSLLRPFAHKLHAAAPSGSGPYPPPEVAIAPPASSAAATAASPPPPLLGMQDHHSTSYLSFQGTHGAPQLDDGDAKYAPHPAFGRGVAPSSAVPRLPDPANFFAYGIMGSEETTTHAHLHPRNGRDELSGLVGGASVAMTTGGCKANYSSSTPPLLERNGRSPSAGGASTAMTTTTPVAATAGMRTQGVDSWVCTSD